MKGPEFTGHVSFVTTSSTGLTLNLCGSRVLSTLLRCPIIFGPRPSMRNEVHACQRSKGAENANDDAMIHRHIFWVARAATAHDRRPDCPPLFSSSLKPVRYVRPAS